MAIPLWGDKGAAGALLLTEMLSLAITLHVYHRFAPLPRLHKPLRTLLSIGALVAVAAACVAVSSTTVGMLVAMRLACGLFQRKFYFFSLDLDFKAFYLCHRIQR